MLAKRAHSFSQQFVPALNRRITYENHRRNQKNFMSELGLPVKTYYIWEKRVKDACLEIINQLCWLQLFLCVVYSCDLIKIVINEQFSVVELKVCRITSRLDGQEYQVVNSIGYLFH